MTRKAEQKLIMLDNIPPKKQRKGDVHLVVNGFKTECEYSNTEIALTDAVFKYVRYLSICPVFKMVCKGVSFRGGVFLEFCNNFTSVFVQHDIPF